MSGRIYSPLLSALASLALLAGSAHAQEEKVLNVYNWSDYIAEDTLANFTKETGIKVTYDTYDSNEILEAKLLAGSTGYDIVVPSLTFVSRQIKAGVFQKLDKSKIPNYSNLDGKILKTTSRKDPGNSHTAVYLWGTTGIGYNVAEVKKRLGNNTAALSSWDLVFDPAVAAKMADCGISFLDAYDELFPAALNYLGKAPTSQRSSDLAAANELLKSARPHIRNFNSSQYINDLANGEVCVAIGWSGDILQARDRADEAGAGVEVAYVIPDEGALLWFDLMAIPTDAPHPGNAHKFINYILEPKVTANISNYVAFANANVAARRFVDSEILSDPGVYPTKKAEKGLYIAPTYRQKTDRELSRYWTALKTGT